MSIIIINSRNPMPKFISVFSAKNPTVNDASVTMLFAEAGMIFGVPQNNNSVLHDSVSGNVKPGVDPERSDYRTLAWREERALIHSRL